MCFTGGSSGFLSSLVCAISYNTRDDNALLYILHSCMYVCMYVFVCFPGRAGHSTAAKKRVAKSQVWIADREFILTLSVVYTHTLYVSLTEFLYFLRWFPIVTHRMEALRSCARALPPGPRLLCTILGQGTSMYWVPRWPSSGNNFSFHSPWPPRQVNEWKSQAEVLK